MNKIVVPPRRRSIICNERIFNLPFPYVVFHHVAPIVEKFRQLKVGFCKEQPTDFTNVYFPILPNIYSCETTRRTNYGLCLDNALDHNGMPLIHIEKLISYFWNSEFSADVSWRGPSLGGSLFETFNKNVSIQTEYFSTLKKWSRLSLEEVLKLDWQEGVLFKEF